MAQETKTPPVILLPMELLEDFELLSNEELGEIIKAIFSYVGKKEKPKFKDRSLQFVFSKMKKICDDNFDKYQKICERNRKNINKRWEQNDDNSLENKGKSDDDTTGYQSIRVDTTRYQSIPVDTNIKYKNKNIKSKNKNIKVKNKTKIENIKYNKKEKNINTSVFIKKEKSNGAIAPTPHTYDFSFISSLGKEMGIDEVYCKKFYDYYNDVGWVTASGEPIKNVKMLLRIWYNKDTNKKNVKKYTKEDLENDAKRIFGDI